MPDTDDLELARWQLATLTGRLRSVEAERDAAVRDRDRQHDLVCRLRRSRSYRIGRILADLARDPVRNGPAMACRAARRLRRHPAAPARRAAPVTPPGPCRPPPPRRASTSPSACPGRDSQALIRALRQRILVDGDHLPVVVTDQPALRGLQVPGVVLEYLPDPADVVAGTTRAEAGRPCWPAGSRNCAGTTARSPPMVVDPRDPPTLARLLEPVTRR